MKYLIVCFLGKSKNLKSDNFIIKGVCKNDK